MHPYLSFWLCCCCHRFLLFLFVLAAQLEGLSQEERDMMSVMGFAGFDSTKVCNRNIHADTTNSCCTTQTLAERV